MAFVDDDMAVFGDHIRHDAFPHEALHQSNIDVSSGFPLSAMDDANLLRRNIKKDSQASDPLIEKLPTMDKDQGVSAARGDQFGGHDGLAKSRRCGEHPCLVSKKCCGSLVLIWRQLTNEAGVERRAVHAFVMQIDPNPCITEKGH